MPKEEWTTAGVRITDEAVLARLQKVIENQSSIIVEHWFFHGSRAPHRFICECFHELREYLHSKTTPGDAICVWQFDECCRNENAVANGKIPDSEGRTPLGGAY